MTKRRPNLGVLGGMGAAAGVRLVQRLVKAAQLTGASRDSDFPEFILYSLPLSGMDETGIIDGAPVKRQLKEAFDRLNVWGCDYVIVACNTVHCFYDDMQSWSNGKVLNMIELTCDTIPKSEGPVGVMCSETTAKLGLYESALKKRKIQTVPVNPTEQRFINAAISAAICGDVGAQHLEGLRSVLNGLKNNGAQKVIIGCTELPLCIYGVNSSVELIFPEDIVIAHAMSLLNR